MKIVKFNLVKQPEDAGCWTNINLGPVVQGNNAVFLGLKYDPMCKNWDLVSHQGFENGEFVNLKYPESSPTFHKGSVDGAYIEFTSPTSTGLVLVKGKKQVVCFELTPEGKIASYGERFY